jgi:hypothetical protein
MRPALITATLIAASIIAIPPAFGGDYHELLGPFTSPSCTPEAQQCLEKLQALLYPSDNPLRSRIEKALFDLLEVDPQCATLLKGMHF